MLIAGLDEQDLDLESYIELIYWVLKNWNREES